jgi:hypothetical protein
MRGMAKLNWTNRVLTPTIPRKESPWPEPGTGKPDASVDDQTQRLFRHLMGLNDVSTEVKPDSRTITLLKKSFQVVEKFCGNSSFVPKEFTDDILEAYLFLLGEADTSKIVDVPLEDFRKIDKALNDCLNKNKPLRIKGTLCETKAEVNKWLIGILLDTEYGTAKSYFLSTDRENKRNFNA